MFWNAKKREEQSDISMPDICLNGERVFLRPPEDKDFEQWNAVRGRNRMFLKAYEPTWPENCLAPDFFKRRRQKQARDWEEDRARSFLIFEMPYDDRGKQSGEWPLIGGVNVNNIIRGANMSGSLGYWLDQEKQGHGFMSEALTILLHYCFTDMKLHRVEAASLLDNERSIALLRRLGFTEEGIARKYLKIDGRWQDHLKFAYCREDWY